MARGNSTLPICFFKMILQTNLQTIKIPNKFIRNHGAGLPNPVMIKPPDGTKWKVFWKNINGEIWFQKGWNLFTQNYSLQHGCLVVFEYKEGSSELDVVIIGQNALEIDYDSSCDTFKDEDENLDHSDDKSVEILNVDNSDDESVEILNEWHHQKKPRERSTLASPRPQGEINETCGRTTSMNCPNGNRAEEVAAKFISNNPFFTVLIKPNHFTHYQLSVPKLKEIVENKEKYVILKNGKTTLNVRLIRLNKKSNYRLILSAGWSLFARETRLQVGDVCVFELINKQDLVFEVHVF